MSETERTPIRVMIVDDHPMVRDGLKVFLLVSPDLEMVGEAGSGAEALRLCGEVLPDVVLMDLKMPGLDGVATTFAIRERHPQVQVIALTSFADQVLVQKAIQAGAIGYLLKDVPATELAEAIRGAHVGRPTLSLAATQALAQAVSQTPPVGDDLTPREREVLALLVEGLSNAQIGDRLTISRSTANYHVSNVLSKLRAANRTEAVRLAMEHKLVP
jgi:NarL family two-component system response regulator LiaR